MNLIKSFSAIITLEKEITTENKETAIDILHKNSFLGYNYEFEKYESFKSILNKYPNRPRYLSKYHNLDFIISCSIGKKYIGYNIDANTEKSNIIINITNDFLKFIDNVIFTYIHNNGDSPINFEEAISQTEIKWLFKYNYFGKKYLEKFGKEFFENLPCEHQEYITDNIIRIDLCKDIFSPIDIDLQKKIVEYCKKHSISVNFYNYKNHLID